jgi:hypothetical protein
VKESSTFIIEVFSINSGIIDKCAEDIVYRVNNILCPLSKVNPVVIAVVENDFAEPLPPVSIK